MAEALVSGTIQLISGLSRVIRVKEELEKFETVFLQSLAVIEDAESRQVGRWFYSLKDVTYDIEDVLDEHSTVILIHKQGLGISNQVCFPILIPCLALGQLPGQFVRCHRLSFKMKILKDRLSSIDAEREKSNFNFSHRRNKQSGRPEEQPGRPETASFIDESKIYGRKEDRNILISKLLCESSEEGRGPSVIPIWGMGGMGKTTLSQLAYNDERVITHFDLRIWVCVSDPFDVVRISKAIIEGILGQAQVSVALNVLQSLLCDSIRGKKFLLVLDDVWNEDPSAWDSLKTPLDVGAPGSRILVTTRNANVASMMRTTTMITLGALSQEDCWLIFSQIAFFGRDLNQFKQLEQIGRQIVSKCQGLPLAAKALGSLMRNKNTREQWEDVLHSEMWKISNENEFIFAPLLLSYYDLSAPLRCCFSYCAIFPKDYMIERDELIKLWMSQGYLNFNNERNKEILGEECFMTLAMRSFFQDFERDYKGSIIRCKMHDLVHDLAQFIRRNECFISEVDGSTKEIKPLREKARHSTFVLASGAAFSISIHNAKSLRTLFLFCSTNTTIDPKMFMHLKCLRTLNLAECWFKELPRGVGKFIHLRYLNLSGNDELERLPETLCDLYNLQTLLINDCMRLRRLPEEMEKLVNLRHLHIDWSFNLERLPKGIAKLTSLQTLDMLVVPRDDKNEAFQLEDLGKLKNLKGYLRICRCGNLESVSDAEKARLWNREQLVDLNLDFDWSGERRLEDKTILEALRPQQYLESLQIRKYRGTAISPDWMMQLTNLRRLVLYSCQYCESLPPLGKLPSLESLEISLMKSVKKVGLEFLGIETDGAENSSFVSFPKLRELRFSTLGKWKVWEGSEGSTEEDISNSIMPCLHSLEIHSCFCLQVLPNFLKNSRLQNFTIIGCTILQEQCQMETGKEWVKISRIPNIKFDHENVRRDGP